MNDVVQNTKLLNYLLEFISDNKRNKFDEIIRHRTRYLTIVLEDIFQPHNTSAVLRSCDCFGIQDIHIIENSNKYQVNPDVALGSSKWLNLVQYNSSEHNTRNCLEQLKSKGYRIVATTPHKNGFTLDELPLDQKTALVFGTEMRGLTTEALEMSDAFVKIPMYGFTESLNISVSAALCLYHLTEKLRRSPVQWQLDETEIIETKLEWVRQVIKNAYLIETRFLKEQYSCNSG
ncbi:MAG: RNA methyltransferase [Bacteroidales bacterium]|nr:RNA methyltransferase [Bacteroidales bacterium]